MEMIGDGSWRQMRHDWVMWKCGKLRLYKFWGFNLMIMESQSNGKSGKIIKTKLTNAPLSSIILDIVGLKGAF